MARKGSKGGGGKFKKPSKPRSSGSSIDKIENYEDTLEKGGVDDFMFKRDQIKFDDATQSDDDEDINGEEGEEVFALKTPKIDMDDDDDEDEDEDEDEEEDEEEEAPVPKGRKEKKKLDLTGKGRFGKPIESSDEEDEEDSGSGSSDDEEGWGRQYYSKPSNRREKEDEGVYDEKREEDREMEEREVRRLQRKAREAFSGVEDWGLEEVPILQTSVEEKEEELARPVVAAPETADPAILIRHMETYEPVKIALARDFPLVLHKLQKTAKGMEAVANEQEGEETLHKGLGWLHYQSLLTYATTLAFYIHLCALPPNERPDMSTHPILNRLLQLKEGVSMLEDLDFAAGESSDVDPLEDGERTGEDEELAELVKKGKAEMMMKQIAVSKAGAAGLQGLGEGDSEDEDGEGLFDEEEDMQNLWHTAGLDEDEVRDLLADAEADGDEAPKKEKKEKKEKKDKKGKKEKKTKEGKKEKKEKKKSQDVEEAVSVSDEDEDSSAHQFKPLEEPAFFSTAKKSKSKDRATASDDILGDPTALNEADASDKERRKRSLQFHTSKIASTSARRSAARAQRMGGDEDVPYRDRQAARDAALRKNSQGGVGEHLDGSEWTEKDKKRAREVRDEEGEDGGGDDGDDYYDLVKRRKTEKQEAREAAHDEFRAAKFASFEDDTHEGGPRALTRAIEKNRGLTPRRSKTGRNPRVKKRQAYEKAKQKVGSQRAVFKGGQAALGGSYAGEKTGISQVSKSRKF